MRFGRAMALFGFFTILLGITAEGRENHGGNEFAPTTTPAFGVRDGRSIENKETLFAELNRETGEPILEILFSEAILQKGSALSGNFGGHLGIAVNNTVFSVSEGYWKKTDRIAVTLPVQDYLYGTVSPDPNQVFASSFGSCYGRSVWGIRVFSLPVRFNLAKINEYFAEANRQSLAKNPDFAYKKRKQNCATFICNALQWAGFSDYTSRLQLFDYPKDISIHFLNELSEMNSEECRFEVVLYSQVENGSHGTSFSVPNLEWQRMLTCLPLFRGHNGLPMLKRDTQREVRVTGECAAIIPYVRESWLKKLKNRITREKWSQGGQ